MKLRFIHFFESTNFFRRGGRNVLEAMWTILYASDDVRSFAARSLVVARALPRGRARWARTVDAPDPVLWGPATLPETTPRKPAPSREGGLWRLAGGRRASIRPRPARRCTSSKTGENIALLWQRVDFDDFAELQISSAAFTRAINTLLHLRPGDLWINVNRHGFFNL